MRERWVHFSYVKKSYQPGVERKRWEIRNRRRKRDRERWRRENKSMGGRERKKDTRGGKGALLKGWRIKWGFELLGVGIRDRVTIIYLLYLYSFSIYTICTYSFSILYTFCICTYSVRLGSEIEVENYSRT